MSRDDGFDEEELKQAVALSLQSEETIRSLNESKNLSDKKHCVELMFSEPPRENANIDIEPLEKSVGLAGLDRKSMEKERLARLARKRKATEADVSPPPLSRKKHASPVPATVTEIEKTSVGVKHLQKPSTPVLGGKNEPQFPKGTVKKTWCFGSPREGDDIKIEELLQKKLLKLAVLSSFQWDMDWLVSKLDIPKTKLLFIMQAKDEATRQQYRQETSGWTNLRLCFPPMPGNVNCMHSKLMLLGYENYLRIAVPTANLTRHDWGESGMLENSVFIIDLPRLSQTNSNRDLGRFGRELKRFCNAMGLQEDITRSLSSFDFSNTEKFAFVHSIGGDQSSADGDDAWISSGHCGLGRAVKDLGLGGTGNVEIDFVASSIGSLNQDFLSSLYLACQGDDGRRELNWRTNAENVVKHAAAKARGATKNRSKAPEADLSGKNEVLQAVKRHMRIYFPSQDTVMLSRGETNAGSVIFLNSKSYNGDRFPRHNMRDCKSTRPGVLMHNKLIYVRPQDPQNPQDLAWIYLGSSNCSESAWGKLTFNKTTRQIRLNCRNWECGVVIPMKSLAPLRVPPSIKISEDMMRNFRGVVPIPMEVPGEAMEGKKPWFCMG